MLLVIDPCIKQYLNPRQSFFSQLMALQGTVYREQDRRRTQRIVLGKKSYFIKQYTGLPGYEVIKNILQLRLPILSAKQEWQALQILAQHHIPAPKVLAYGIRRAYTPWQESFVLMEDLVDMVSLETLCHHTIPLRTKRLLLRSLAELAAKLHQQGLNHRDFYLCHCFVDPMTLDHRPVLYLIDLHRAAKRQAVPKRWLIKDLAGLYFSAQTTHLTQRDYYRFIQLYRQQSFKQTWLKESAFWRQVQQTGETLFSAHHLT